MLLFNFLRLFGQKSSLKIISINMKQAKRLNWHSKKKVFEDVTRATILNMGLHLNNRDFMDNVIKSIVDNDCVTHSVLKNVPLLITHLKRSITQNMLANMAVSAVRLKKTFYKYVLDSELNVGDTSGLVFINMLDYDFGSEIDVFYKTARDAEASDAVIDMELDVGDRVKLISPLLIPSLVSDKGSNFYVGRNINLKLFSNMIVIESKKALKNKDSVLVYLSKREGVVNVQKKYITLKQ